MDRGSEFSDFFIGPAGMHPVGEQNDHQTGIRIHPEGGAGEAQMSHSLLGKISAG